MMPYIAALESGLSFALFCAISAFLMLVGGSAMLSADQADRPQWTPLWLEISRQLFGVLHGGVALNLSVLVLTLTLAILPAGATIRPMGWSGEVGVIAVVALCWTLPRSWRDVRQGRAGAGFLGLCLSVTPFPLAMFLFDLCVRLKEFHVAP